MFPQFLYQYCIEPQGIDCHTNGWSISNRFVNCSGKLYRGPFGLGITISKEFDYPPDTYSKFSFSSGILILGITNLNILGWMADILVDVTKYFGFDGQYVCLNPSWQDQIVEKAVTFVYKQGIVKVKIKYLMVQIILLMMNHGELEMQDQRLDIHELIFFVSANFKVINGKFVLEITQLQLEKYLSKLNLLQQ